MKRSRIVKRLAVTAGAIALGATTLTGCDPAIPACSNSKPVPGISLRGATLNSFGSHASCDGVTTGSHYFWIVRLSDGQRTYLKIVPR